MKKNVRVITSRSLNRQFKMEFIKDITVEQFNALTDGQYSRNSLLAQTKDWNLFTSFCHEKGVSPLPASSTAVRLYLEKESKNRKYATIKRYAVTIGLIHRVLDLPDPTTQTKIRETLSSLRLSKHDDARMAHAFELEHLTQLTSQLKKRKSVRNTRNLAIYFAMFECMLKRSELRQLRMEDCTLAEDKYAVIYIGNHQYQLSEEGTKYLEQWLSIRGDCAGPLFTAIDKHDNLSSSPLDDSSIYRIMRSASDVLGLDIKFSGQSLRVGAVKELAIQGVKTREIQQHGRWQSAAMPYQYIGNRAKAASEKRFFKTIKPWD